MRNRISPATVISCVALFFSLAGTGIAASHYLITSVSQIKPSVRHALHGERGLVGPQGAAGPQGTQGTQGAVGPAGSVNFDAIYYATSAVLTLNSAALTRTAAVAECPRGYAVLNGGFTQSNVTVLANWNPPETRDWVVDVAAVPGGQDGTVQAYADCVPR